MPAYTEQQRNDVCLGRHMTDTMCAIVRRGEWVCSEEGSKEQDRSEGNCIHLDATTFPEGTRIVISEPVP